MKIDTSNWKEFRVGELFECDTTLGIPSKNDLDDGDIPYVTRSASNNGFSGTCGNDDHLNKGKCITIGAEGFVAFYQPEDFVAGNKVYTIRHESMTELSGLFVCAALNVLSDRYSFSEARILDKIKEEVIKLPATSSGEPDWDYMEQYMKDVMDDCEAKYQTLVRISKEKHKVDTNEWGEFRVGELFRCDTTLGVPSKNDLDDGDIPYITRSASNNGFSGTCGNSDHLNSGKCITIGAEGFVAFYQPEDFVAGNKVYTIRHESMTELSGLFVCAALNVLSDRYSFSEARILDKIKEEVIKLPITTFGEPDWDYMEQYMKDVMNRQSNVVAALSKMLKN